MIFSMVPDATITLTTDFGNESPYVAAMKGSILAVNPAARILDLSHQIPPQDVRHAAFFLAAAIPYFPPSAIHVVVVDPGVGSERAILYVEVNGRPLLVPDNGCWTCILGADNPTQVICLSDRRYWRETVSNTFHGRDIFAPVAGHLSLGVNPKRLGIPATTWTRLEMPAPEQVGEGWRGEVVFIDHFGNLVTNIPGSAITPPLDLLRVGKARFRRRCRWVRTYAEAKAGALVVLVSSYGLVEVAIVQGDAARKLGARVGTPVEIWDHRRSAT